MAEEAVFELSPAHSYPHEPEVQGTDQLLARVDVATAIRNISANIWC